MTSAQLRLLASWLVIAILLSLIAWRLWRRWQMRFSALEAALFKRTPEGWTFDSPYPRIFGRRRSTYLLTDAQKERLTEGLRRWVRTAVLLAIGLCVALPAIAFAFWLPKHLDVPKWLLAGSPGVWLLLCLVLVVVYGTLATFFGTAQEEG